MKTTIAALFVCTLILMGCGIAKDAEDTLKEVKKTNEGIEKTNKAIHLQTLSVALDNLLKDTNTKNPLVPVGMIPNAKVFADEATTEELIEEYHMLLTDAMKGANETFEYIGTRAHDRLVRFFAASAIAAMTPKEKFEKLVEEQIKEEGQFYDTMRAFILTRYTFTKAYLYQPIFDITLVKWSKDGEVPVNTPRTATIKLLKEAIETYENLKAIYDMPFAKNLVVTVPQALTFYKEEVDPETNKPVKVAFYKDYSVKIDRQDFEKLDAKKSTLAQMALEKFDDVKIPKMQTTEAKELLRIFR